MQMESSKHQGTLVVGGPTTIFAPLHSLQGRPPSSGPTHTQKHQPSHVLFTKGQPPPHPHWLCLYRDG